jgi:RNA-directed DNA polymerase
VTSLVENLIAETGLRNIDILRIMNRAPSMYKFYEIEKRTGGKREIAQPAREVKYVQRALIKVLLAGLPIHPSATAYRTGLSIRDNALPHAGRGPILKIDLKDFFPSIRALDWLAYCESHALGLSEVELDLTSRLLFHRRRGGRVLTLAVGAPSSPMLSNLLMYDFDDQIVTNLENDQVVYTRYADDMTFSAPRTGYLNGVMKTVAGAIRNIRYPKLEINAKKTTYVTSKFGRSVTGLTLANDGRVTIGRENKRKLHAAVHHAKMGKATTGDLQVTAGMLAYVNAVEPEFLVTLKARYGAEVIVGIQKTVRVGIRPDRHLPPFAPVGDSTNEQELEAPF